MIKKADMAKLVKHLKGMSYDKLVRYEDNQIYIDGDLIDTLYYQEISFDMSDLPRELRKSFQEDIYTKYKSFDDKVGELGYEWEFVTSSIIGIYDNN